MVNPIQFDWRECRDGTREAILVTLRRFVSGERTTSINMPTRYGKTHTGRLITGISTMGWVTPDGQRIPPFASVNVWVTINLMLREQAASKKHWSQFTKIFQPSQQILYGEIQDTYNSHAKLVRNAQPNGEHFLAVNVHRLLSVPDVYARWIESLSAKGLPAIFHFDEVHLYGELKPWGKVIQEFIDAGALVMVWTATPRRADGGIIPGFRPILLGSEDREIYVFKDEVLKDEKRLGIFEVHQQHTDDFLLQADVNVPFTAAWNEGYLLKPSYLRVDVDLSEIDVPANSDVRNAKLSNLTAPTVRKYGIVGKCTRHLKTIRRAVGLAYTHLQLFRKLHPEIKLVGFTVSDQDGGRNEAANIVKKEFLRLDSTLKIAIATQNVDDARDLIKNFEDSDYDIILFKDMGGAGWDCAKVKVVLDLSDSRQIAHVIQRWMRGATPYKGLKLFALIVLADQLNETIWQECIDDLGGAASVSIAEMIRMELLELQERQKNAWVINDTAQGDFSDSDKNYATADQAHLANALMKLVPEFRGLRTDAALAVGAQHLGISIAAPPPIQSIDEQIDEEQSSIIKTLDEATRRFYPKYFQQYTSATYGDASKYLYRRTYDMAGLSYDRYWVEVRKNRDVNQLRILSRAAQLVLDWVNQNA